ncbi:nascent polypeptide-associated complex protein [Candidatus Bathyarchaeota archaeon]|nr:MAG: nascent polypeptide-associated complex protein [Candidatus Bathyarchaeota archaeon]
MMRGLSPREARRLMKRMGLNMAPLPDVEEVIIRTKDKEITIEVPEVSVLEMRGQRIYQIIGGEVTERQVKRKLKIPEEDVQLVAQQANVTLERAREALEQTNGDLAQAILLLTQT